MPRRKGPITRQVHIRVPEMTYAEMILLYPDLQEPMGGIRYGAMNDYFCRLLREDLIRRTKNISDSMKEASRESA